MNRREFAAALGFSGLALASGSLAGCDDKGAAEARALPLVAAPKASELIAAARAQIGVTVHYDPAYTALAYPGGDVPRERGVCTDVVIRAYRDAFGIDLQREVHEDMGSAFARYPKIWGLKRPDANIDHRRVPNLRRFFERQQAELPNTIAADAWQPGDIVTSLVGGRLPHIGIVSDRRAASGNPLLIHNIGRGTQEEDILFAYPINGRYRWKLA